MKKGIKAGLILAAVLAVVGIGMTIGGFAAGATREVMSLAEYPSGKLGKIVEKYSLISSDRIERDWNSEDEKNMLTKDDGNVLAGDESRFSVAREENVKKIIIDADVADVTICSLKDDSMVGQEIDGTAVTDQTIVGEIRKRQENQKVERRVEDQTLYLTISGEYDLIPHLDQDFDTELTLFLPEDMISEVSVKVNVGDVTLNDRLTLDTLYADLDTGDLDLEGELTIRKDLIVEQSVGDLDLEYMNCMGNVDITSGVGDASLHFNDLKGNLDIKAGTGDVDVALPGRQKDYNFDLFAGIGSLECGDITYGADWEDDSDTHDHKHESGLENRLQLTNNPDGSTITIQTDVGGIEVSFE